MQTSNHTSDIAARQAIREALQAEMARFEASHPVTVLPPNASQFSRTLTQSERIAASVAEAGGKVQKRERKPAKPRITAMPLEGWIPMMAEIEQLADKHGITKEAISQNAGKSSTYMSRFVSDRKATPPHDTAVAMLRSARMLAGVGE